MRTMASLILLAAIASTAALPAAWAQGPAPAPAPAPSSAPPPRRLVRLEGRATVQRRDGKRATVTLSAHHWIIANGQRVEKLPEQGLLVVQLRAGADLTTTINGQRRKRGTDEFWLVPAGATWSLETGEDTVVLEIVALR